MSLLVTELIALVLYKNGQGPLSDYDLQVFMAPGTGVLWIVEAKQCLKCKESDACLWIILFSLNVSSLMLSMWFPLFSTVWKYLINAIFSSVNAI